MFGLLFKHVCIQVRICTIHMHARAHIQTLIKHKRTKHTKSTCKKHKTHEKHMQKTQTEEASNPTTSIGAHLWSPTKHTAQSAALAANSPIGAKTPAQPSKHIAHTDTKMTSPVGTQTIQVSPSPHQPPMSTQDSRGARTPIPHVQSPPQDSRQNQSTTNPNPSTWTQNSPAVNLSLSASLPHRANDSMSESESRVRSPGPDLSSPDPSSVGVGQYFSDSSVDMPRSESRVRSPAPSAGSNLAVGHVSADNAEPSSLPESRVRSPLSIVAAHQGTKSDTASSASHMPAHAHSPGSGQSSLHLQSLSPPAHTPLPISAQHTQPAPQNPPGDKSRQAITHPTSADAAPAGRGGPEPGYGQISGPGYGQIQGPGYGLIPGSMTIPGIPGGNHPGVVGKYLPQNQSLDVLSGSVGGAHVRKGSKGSSGEEEQNENSAPSGNVAPKLEGRQYEDVWEVCVYVFVCVNTCSSPYVCLRTCSCFLAL
jgi:hypothetical protein